MCACVLGFACINAQMHSITGLAGIYFSNSMLKWSNHTASALVFLNTPSKTLLLFPPMFLFVLVSSTGIFPKRDLISAIYYHQADTFSKAMADELQKDGIEIHAHT